jgi:hypothetical protein
MTKTLIFIFLVSSRLFCQSNLINWQRCLGGSDVEPSFSSIANYIQSTQDGGIIHLTATNSNDGDVTNNSGGSDIWVNKLNSNGILEWQKNIGGQALDLPYSISENDDGSFIVLGHSFSSELIGFHGQVDILLTKLTSNGQISWQKCIGGTYSEIILEANNFIGIPKSHLINNNNNGYIIAFESRSPDGDIGTNYGNYDIVVMIIDNFGNILNKKIIGGSLSESVKSISRLNNNQGYLILGETTSNDGVFNQNLGDQDIFVVRIDNNLNIDWLKCLGTNSMDSSGSFFEDNNGNIIVSGVVDQFDPITNGDVLVCKLDTSGNIIFSNLYGGSNEEGNMVDISIPFKLEIYPMGDCYLLTTASSSNDGDVSLNFGGSDFWIVKINSNGDILWEKTFGGDYTEHNMSNVIIHSNLEISFGIDLGNNSGNLFHPNFHYYPFDVNNGFDIGILKLDSLGNLLSFNCFGGDELEWIDNLIYNSSLNQYTFCGRTQSSNGDVVGFHGYEDSWIVELNQSLGVNELFSDQKRTPKNIYDLLGREMDIQSNTLLFYQYNDGTVEKKVIIE